MSSLHRLPSFLTSLVVTLLLTSATTATVEEQQHANVDESSSTTQYLRSHPRDLSSRDKYEHVLCRVTMVDTEYDDDHDGVNDEQPSCIPIVDWKETDDLFPIDLDEDFFQLHLRQIQHGKLLISISNANLTETGIETGPDTQYKLLNDDNQDNHPDHERYLRQLEETEFDFAPHMTVAIVRISTQDAKPSLTLNAIKDSLFGSNGINVQTQYDACSFGKLKWSLATHSNALVDVTVPMSIKAFENNAGGLVTAAQQTLKNDPTNSIEQVSALANRVLMCLPPGTGNWAASAGVKHWRVQMNSQWCTSLSGTMHELGHTMGLLHSNSQGMAYNDRSGYMGSGYTDSTWPRKCFNGFNSWHFGWYSSKSLKLNPVVDGNHLINLASFTDFDLAKPDEPVIINIADTYYLLYNRAKKMNVDTEMKQNQVTITQNMPDGSGTDSLAGLSAGDQFKMSFLKSEGVLIVEACEAKTQSGGADYMVLSIGMEKSLCGTGASASRLNGNGGIQQLMTEEKVKEEEENSGFLNGFVFWLLSRFRRSN